MAEAKVWVIGDTHFGHRRILEFEGKARPFSSIEEHDRELIARWNSVVREKDTVWHLGDVWFGANGHEALATLKGYKRLVLGNHDHFPLELYQQYFDRIYGAATHGGAILTHVPVHPGQLEFRYKLNIHGHMHSSCIDDPRYVNVSAERLNLTPVLLQKAMQGQVKNV